ncbi:MAG: CRISPR-associated endonuclease Cas2 [Aquificaceae bacterium]|jgi:CRISPR-associated endonuclease Cas2|uniref:CRISPR-associated endonuclease Cas2 n=1 Tax=Hydrogenobacter sp. Uz 6-8 TaxID=3384828 RepID=UPI003094E085
MRLVVYDYTEERIRKKVRKSLKRHGLHAQLSVFETHQDPTTLKTSLLTENSPNFRLTVFRLRKNAQPIKIGNHYDGSDQSVF